VNIVKLTRATTSVVSLVFVPANDRYEQLLIFFSHPKSMWWHGVHTQWDAMYHWE